MSNQIEILVRLLREARRLDNLTVRAASEVASWRVELDEVLAQYPNDDKQERYGAPSRVEHRRLVDDLFRRPV
jgi:hypothetical protein